MSDEAPYISIAQRKRAEADSRIPQGWRIPAHRMPPGMITPEASISATKSLANVNVMDIPRTCGLLTRRELDITEDWDVQGLLAQIAGGKLTATEVCEAFCKRAAISHQLTRCITEPLFSSALERARQLDAHLKQTGTPIGPLHGLPISVKDTFDVQGVDSSIGIAGLAFKPATQNAPLVDLLLSLGAVIVAKTNVPQTMGALDSVNHLFGRTWNPINRQLTAGGSSGGEGVLVAMRGSMLGIGTDVGGSIRIPAMCNGTYGFKPSVGRVPYGGQQSGHPAGSGRVGLQAVAGPLARSVKDLGAIMQEIMPRAELWGEDCVPGSWPGAKRSQRRKFTVGVLRSDGVVTPLPLIDRILTEVAQALGQTGHVEVVEVPTPPALTKCQRLANALMSVDGGGTMMDLLESTSEPLIPWLQGRMRRGKPRTVDELQKLMADRSQIEREMMKMWTVGTGGRTRTVDAIICPIAPHPVPEIDRYNSVGYTSSFVLLDYPAGVIPVRKCNEGDLERGREIDSQPLSSWDKRNRELWNSNSVRREVYLGSPLSIQVLTPKLHDYELFEAMELIDDALRSQRLEAKL